MRLALVIYHGLDGLSGGYLYDRIMVDGLRRLGHEVEVVSLTGGSYLKRLAANTCRDLDRRLLEGGFDLVVEDELCHPSLFAVNRRLRRQGGPPLVALVHHLLCREPRRSWQNHLLSLAERRFLNSVDGFIFNSETTRQTVLPLLDREPVHTIAKPAGDRFGSPLSDLQICERARRSGPLHLLFLGNVIERKGLLPLLTALAEVDCEQWRLTVAGSLDAEPCHAKQVRRFLDRHRLAEQVRFHGPLTDTELTGLLTASQLLCMPYAYEGFGIAILEGMAFGLPALGCRKGAAGETIVHGSNGFLLAPGDRAGLQALIGRLYRDREELVRLALAARNGFRQSPGWQDAVARIDTFLGQLADSRGRRQGAGRDDLGVVTKIEDCNAPG